MTYEDILKRTGLNDSDVVNKKQEVFAMVLCGILMLLCCNTLFAQQKKYNYTTEYVSTYINCRSLYDRTLYEYPYISSGWTEYSYTYTYITNIKFSSQDHYEIWVTFERKDSTLIKTNVH